MPDKEGKVDAILAIERGLSYLAVPIRQSSFGYKGEWMNVWYRIVGFFRGT